MSEGEGGVKVQCCEGRNGAQRLNFTLFIPQTVNEKAGPFGTAALILNLFK